MKKYLIFLILISYAVIGRSQETPPPISSLKQLTTSTFYINPADSAIWQYKGAQFGWNRVGKYGDLPTFGNGLTKKGNILELGGALSNETTLESAYNLKLGDHINNRAALDIAATANTLYGTAQNATFNSTFVLNPNSSTYGIYNSFGDGIQLSLNPYGGAFFTDQLFNKGLVYTGDYEANFTDKSLITKQFVNNNYAPVTNGTGYIQNQNLSAQPASYWVSGQGRASSFYLQGTGNYAAVNGLSSASLEAAGLTAYNAGTHGNGYTNYSSGRIVNQNSAQTFGSVILMSDPSAPQTLIIPDRPGGGTFAFAEDYNSKTASNLLYAKLSGGNNMTGNQNYSGTLSGTAWGIDDDGEATFAGITLHHAANTSGIFFDDNVRARQIRYSSAIYTDNRFHVNYSDEGASNAETLAYLSDIKGISTNGSLLSYATVYSGNVDSLQGTQYRIATSSSTNRPTTAATHILTLQSSANQIAQFGINENNEAWYRNTLTGPSGWQPWLKLLTSADLSAVETPLTFGAGLTRISNNVTNNLVTGINGGQTIIGGTAASNDLVLQSTSHATKGKIRFGSSSGYYDQSSNNLYIPNQLLAGTTTAIGRLTIQQASGDGLSSGIALSNAAGTGSARIWVDGADNSRISGNSTEAKSILINGGGGGQLGINTSTTTHQITLGQASNNGIAAYNTTDQTTNYERARSYWLGNIYNLQTESGGTGIGRDLKLSAASSSITLSAAAGNNYGIELRRDGTTVSNVVSLNSTGLLGASGTQSFLSLIPTVNQSSTAGYNMLYVSPYEQAVGSSTKYLINAGINSAANASGTHSPKFTVDNTGAVYSASSVNIAGRLAVGLSSGAAAKIQIANNTFQTSAAFSKNGFGLFVDASTYQSQAASGSPAIAAVNGLGVATLTATNSQSITNAANLYIDGAPVASTNVSITNPYALYVNSGSSYFGDAIYGGNFYARNNSTPLIFSGNTSFSGASLVLPGGSAPNADAPSIRMGNTAKSTSTMQAQTNGVNIGFLAYASDFPSLNTKRYGTIGIDGSWYLGNDNGNTVTYADTGIKLQVAGKIKSSDDIEISDSTKGIIIKSPDGSRWRITVANGGTLTTTAL